MVEGGDISADRGVSEGSVTRHHTELRQHQETGSQESETGEKTLDRTSVGERKTRRRRTEVKRERGKLVSCFVELQLIIMTGSSGSLIILLCALPMAVMSLTCYTCMFPAISPLDCLQFAQECPAGQRCLFSMATAVRGSLSIVLHEKSCAIPSQCGLSGQKQAAGLNFTYQNHCCDTDLCNAAVRLSAPCWRELLLSLSAALVLLLVY
ncbi:hypothetical protein NFI96_032245 [Prochilodus magdalenae]|nr:hypothetical protein NFI96_032245 [Prochilodus magdalenae]